MKIGILALVFTTLFASTAVFADDIAVTINGKNYTCSGNGNGGGGSSGCTCTYQKGDNGNFPNICLYPTSNSDRAISCWFGGADPTNAFKTCYQKLKDTCGGN